MFPNELYHPKRRGSLTFEFKNNGADSGLFFPILIEAVPATRVGIERPVRRCLNFDFPVEGHSGIVIHQTLVCFASVVNGKGGLCT